MFLFIVLLTEMAPTSNLFCSIFLLLVVSVALAIPKPEEKEKKDRVLDNVSLHLCILKILFTIMAWLVWNDPFRFLKDLSDQEHYQNAEHNTQYDHEAFLGEEAKTFDQLTPEESRRRLGWNLYSLFSCSYSRQHCKFYKMFWSVISCQ